MLIILYVNETFCLVTFIAFYAEMLKRCARTNQENKTLIESIQRAAREQGSAWYFCFYF